MNYLGFILTTSLAFAVGTTLVFAQDYVPGTYDGRDIAGWTFSEAKSDEWELPVWVPTPSQNDEMNCNVDIDHTRADITYDEFSAMWQRLSPLDSDPPVMLGRWSTYISSIEQFEIDGRPAVWVMASFSPTKHVDMVTVHVLIGDPVPANRIYRITCHAIADDWEIAEPLFRGFVDGLILLRSE